MTLNSLESYGIGFQTKVMSALLTDKPFLQNVNDILTEEYFSNTAHKWIVDEVLNTIVNTIATQQWMFLK